MESIDKKYQERRRFVRVEDRVGLGLREIELEEKDSILQMYRHKRNNSGLANLLQMERERQRPLFTAIQDNYPDIANYIFYLENQLTNIANSIAATDFNIKDMPSRRVNISAQGMSFRNDTAYAPGSCLELSLMLFPSNMRILCYGKVLAASGQNDNYKIRVEYLDMHEEDQEMLIKHIHQVQLRAIRKKNAESSQ